MEELTDEIKEEQAKLRLQYWQLNKINRPFYHSIQGSQNLPINVKKRKPKKDEEKRHDKTQEAIESNFPSLVTISLAKETNEEKRATDPEQPDLFDYMSPFTTSTISQTQQDHDVKNVNQDSDQTASLCWNPGISSVTHESRPSAMVKSLVK